MLVTALVIVYRGGVDFDAYARTAVDLVNAPLEDLADLRVLLGARTWWTEQATERDATALRRTRRKLREVFEQGAAGQDNEAVEALNALLATHPLQPRISGHDKTDWHMHVTGRGASVSAEYAAGAIWGLSVWLCNYGSARFGVCVDDRCRNVYLDTSSNNCRRFCSERCATRSHVAAHRRRKRSAAADSASA